jgi:uncharacterized protein YndB with AHSA1/START domain
MADHIARADTTIDAAPDKVWALLTQRGPDPDIMFGAEVISDWLVGSPVRWKGEWQGKEFEDKGEVLEIDPPNRLVVTHFSPMSGEEDAEANYHRLSYVLAPEGDGTRVELEQAGNSTEEAAEHSLENWQAMLDGLKKAAERA